MIDKVVSYCGSSVGLSLPFSFLEQCAYREIKWSEVAEFIESFNQWRNKYIGYNLANNKTYIKYKDKEYLIGVFTDNVGFWIKDGAVSLFDIKIDKNSIVKQSEIDEIATEFDYDIEGYFKCCNCGKHIKKVGGTIFAGRYCEECSDTDEYKKNKQMEYWD